MCVCVGVLGDRKSPPKADEGSTGLLAGTTSFDSSEKTTVKLSSAEVERRGEARSLSFAP